MQNPIQPICPVCESIQTKFKYALTKQSKIYSCIDCSLEFIYPPDHEKSSMNYYNDTYYKSWGISKNTENESVKNMKSVTFNGYLDIIGQYKTKGKILDVGCAMGYFMEVAKKRGFECSGIELSAYSSEIAKEKLGQHEVFTGTLEESIFQEKTFDVIVMLDLIEHVKDLYAAMKKVYDLLKNDGIVFITTPNTSSFSKKFAGINWPHYKPEHFYYFNRKSAEYLAYKSGFKIAEFRKTRKALNFNYIYSQFKVYKNIFVLTLLKILQTLIPGNVLKKNYIFLTGEMTIIFKKI